MAVTRCRAATWQDPKTGAVHVPPCTAEQQLLQQAAARLQEARQQFEEVQKWRRLVDQAAERFRLKAQQLVRTLDTDQPEGNSFLNERIAELRAYLSESAASISSSIPSPLASSLSSKPPGAGTSASVLGSAGIAAAVAGLTAAGAPLSATPPPGTSTAWGATGAPAPSAPAAQAPGSTGASGWVDQGVQAIAVDQIDLTQSPVQGLADFHKITPQEVTIGFQKLQTVVAPAVAQGHGADYFAQLDVAQGLSGEDGYQHIYEVFYGGDAIRLNKVGNSYDVVNGYHRLYIARQLGLKSVPAHVITSTS
jgi:hypothetical protein